MKKRRFKEKGSPDPHKDRVSVTLIWEQEEKRGESGSLSSGVSAQALEGFVWAAENSYGPPKMGSRNKASLTLKEKFHSLKNNKSAWGCPQPCWSVQSNLKIASALKNLGIPAIYPEVTDFPESSALSLFILKTPISLTQSLKMGDENVILFSANVFDNLLYAKPWIQRCYHIRLLLPLGLTTISAFLILKCRVHYEFMNLL